MEPADAMKELDTIKGIGPKLAACVLSFTCKQPWLAVDSNVANVAKESFPPATEALLEASYFQYMAPGHCKRGCPIKVSPHAPPPAPRPSAWCFLARDASPLSLSRHAATGRCWQRLGVP